MLSLFALCCGGVDVCFIMVHVYSCMLFCGAWCVVASENEVSG